MPNDQCVVKEVLEPTLVIDIEESVTSLVEVECPTTHISIEECTNNIIEIETGDGGGLGDVEVSIVETPTCIIEIEERILSVEFIESVVINEAPGGGDVEAICGSAVGATTVAVNRVVALLPDGRIEHADKDNPDHHCATLGVSKQSGAIGSLVNFVKFGKLSGAAFGSIGETFFLGNDGFLLSTAPTSGAWIEIGTQETANTIHIDIQQPVIL